MRSTKDWPSEKEFFSLNDSTFIKSFNCSSKDPFLMQSSFYIADISQSSYELVKEESILYKLSIYLSIFSFIDSSFANTLAY